MISNKVNKNPYNKPYKEFSLCGEWYDYERTTNGHDEQYKS